MGCRRELTIFWPKLAMFAIGIHPQTCFADAPGELCCCHGLSLASQRLSSAVQLGLMIAVFGVLPYLLLETAR
jgi:hypothetical protein